MVINNKMVKIDLTRLMLLLFIACISCTGYAGDNNPGYLIEQFSIVRDSQNSPQVMIFDAGPHAEKPDCSTKGDEWAVDISTPDGQAIMLQLLNANAGRKSIVVIGQNACIALSDRETPLSITTL